jgi:hypothetical protein
MLDWSQNRCIVIQMLIYHFVERTLTWNLLKHNLGESKTFFRQSRINFRLAFRHKNAITACRFNWTVHLIKHLLH